MTFNSYETIFKLACINTYSDFLEEKWKQESTILQALNNQNICSLLHSDVESPPKGWQKQQDLKFFNIE